MRKDLAEELAQTEGEPQDSDADLGDEMPVEHGRTVPAAQSWRLHLVMGEKGREHTVFVEPISANVTTILRHHPSWEGVIAYDEFLEAIIATRAPSWDPEDAPEDPAPGVWTDQDSGRLVAWLARSEHLKVRRPEVEAGLDVAAHARRIHPVRQYLRELAWDGQPRIDRLLPDYFGTADGDYEQAVGSRWLISAVARVMRPGCQVDCTLVIEGWQGAKKTSGFRALVPVSEWYADSGLTIGSKDSYGSLHAVWIYGLDELDSLKRGEVTRVKNFLTQTKDHYRPPYAMRDRDFLRQNVFCGTTNEDRYLPDRTGNRRFWPARCLRLVDPGAIARDRDQLWAEAFLRFKAGERWYVDTPGLQVLCAAQQADRVVVDPWVEMIAAWLEKPTQMCIDAHGAHREPLALAEGVSTSDVLIHALGLRKGEVDVRHEMRVGHALRDLGYVRTRRMDAGVRGYRYVLEEPPTVGMPDADDGE